MTSTLRILALAAGGALALGLTACTATGPAPQQSTATTPAPQESTDASSPSPTAPSPTETVADGGCTGAEGVSVFVDAGNLPGGDEIDRASCVLTGEPIGAADALDVLGVTTEGTTQDGDQVVCRVNGLPSASDPVGSTEDPSYVETCETTPADFASWSLWVKPAGEPWAYAQQGLPALELAPGDSMELLFTLDGAPATPDA